MGPSVSLKTWQALSTAEREAVLSLTVDSRQIEFAGTVGRSVEDCRAAQTDDVAGLATFRGDRVVGFLVLKRGKRAPAWARPGAAVVSAMRIDRSCQGQGLGSAALQSVLVWTAEHWPESSELTLSVDEENHSARRAYVRAGFVDLGKREQGRIGWVRYMSRPVRSPR